MIWKFKGISSAIDWIERLRPAVSQNDRRFLDRIAIEWGGFEQDGGSYGVGGD
jgi:hypothetical protein